ncbi:hypothetical protein BV898_10331 [Hypsibius exemplaris]|uniref:Reverse transcriptase domain-containing protein n=1 Tax=Hypsibius exemplaris TaxID=2072580 RepID=A0A1W0WJT0_HYPEX|nr:hypothetical protein BV898_10331 [Hypsibius exemplaris]
MRRIFEITKAAFDKAEGELTIIHDCDLTKWARDAAGEVELSSLPSLQTLDPALQKAKHICDRKITEYVTRRMVENEADRYIAAADFVQYVKELITSYGPDCVLNADQSGFQYEIHSGKRCGRAEVTGDTFGPQVQRDLFTAPNILVTASSSGKMKREHLKGRHVQIVTVPPETTPLCQPLMSRFPNVRTLSKIGMVSGIETVDEHQCELHLRTPALKLQSCVHNQFSSPRSPGNVEVWWTHPGYFENDEHVEFKTPSQFCFESDAAKENHRCSVASCEKTHFLTCAWWSQSGGSPLLADRLTGKLASILSLMLHGEVPTDVLPLLYGANLIALNKKGGGIRPIAVGNTLRRLLGKIVSRREMAAMGDLARSVQPYGTPGGAEAMVHAARAFLEDEDDKQVLLKLDFANAFNTVDRGQMLSAVKKYLPRYYAFIWQMYRHPTELFFAEFALQSATGVQQGDPLGPLLFCLVTMEMSKAMESPFNAWYLDDGTIGGPVETVVEEPLLQWVVKWV